MRLFRAESARRPLRHRPRSISPRSAAFHAKRRWPAGPRRRSGWAPPWTAAFRRERRKWPSPAAERLVRRLIRFSQLSSATSWTFAHCGQQPSWTTLPGTVVSPLSGSVAVSARCAAFGQTGSPHCSHRRGASSHRRGARSRPSASRLSHLPAVGAPPRPDLRRHAAPFMQSGSSRLAAAWALAESNP